VPLHHTVVAYKGCGGNVRCILDIGSGWVQQTVTQPASLSEKDT